MSALHPPWLVARPIAHRGLHDRAQGVIENSVSAMRRAVDGDFAIECDVQISADGEAMVFHDDTLERLTEREGRVDALDAAILSKIALRGGADTITPLPDYLALLAGRVPLVVEIKSAFNGDMRLAERTARIVATYSGPLALKSFDPQVMTHLRFNRGALGIAHIPLGIVAEAHYDDDYWSFLAADEKLALEQFLHWDLTQPDFLSWSVRDLPHAIPHLLRRTLGIPVMTWTVRTPQQRDAAAKWADQVVFEGWHSSP